MPSSSILLRPREHDGKKGSKGKTQAKDQEEKEETLTGIDPDAQDFDIHMYLYVVNSTLIIASVALAVYYAL